MKVSSIESSGKYILRCNLEEVRAANIQEAPAEGLPQQGGAASQGQLGGGGHPSIGHAKGGEGSTKCYTEVPSC